MTSIARLKRCDGLNFLGIAIDDSANQLHGSRISMKHSKVRVRVVASQEDRQIARRCRRIMRGTDTKIAPNSST